MEEEVELGVGVRLGEDNRLLLLGTYILRGFPKPSTKCIPSDVGGDIIFASASELVVGFAFQRDTFPDALPGAGPECRRYSSQNDVSLLFISRRVKRAEGIRSGGNQPSFEVWRGVEISGWMRAALDLRCGFSRCLSSAPGPRVGIKRLGRLSDALKTP